MTATTVYENRFPAEREALREYLLEAVDSIADVLVAGRDESEDGRRLAASSAEALHSAGLFMLKTPRELGGAEAHPVVQMDVIEAVAMIDSAAAWCMFITAAVSGASLAPLSDEALEELHADGFPRISGSLRPAGQASKVDGGYRITGRWSWGSGVEYAGWVMVPVFSQGDGPPLVRALVPMSEVTLHDNWHPLGMRGTGSCDYEIDDVFVPARFVTDLLGTQPTRGGALHRLGLPGYVVNEHGSFAYALGRLALRTMAETAVEKKRGYMGGVSLADREVFQRAIGRGTTRMNACAAGMAEALERLFDSAADGLPDPALVTEAQSMSVWCTDEAVDVVGEMFRLTGGSAVMPGSEMQRILRDVYTVQSHLMVSAVTYEKYGQILLGMTEGGTLP